MIFKLIWKLIKFILEIAIVIYLVSLGYVLWIAHARNVPTHADAALVLGAKVNLDNTPSQPLLNRTDEAIKLYKQGTVSWLLTTGGQGLGVLPESEASRGLAATAGVPLAKILYETDSHDTLENVQDILPQARANNIKSVIIVSDRFHLARGVLVARYFGFNPVGWDYPDTSSYTTQELVIDYAREAAAIPVYIFEMHGEFPQLFNQVKSTIAKF
jgi:vancomycin permeability regulator SanA